MSGPVSPTGGDPRQRRRAWTIRVVPLGSESGDDLSATTTAEERLAMMWPLACDAWSVMGRPIPSYSRLEAPVRVLSRGRPA